MDLIRLKEGHDLVAGRLRGAVLKALRLGRVDVSRVAGRPLSNSTPRAWPRATRHRDQDAGYDVG